jgi:uncharacterized LabA/DUF88 family protein
MKRVVAYIDGMNLYHGLRDRYRRRLHWLDVAALARSVMLPGQQLRRVSFFTARIRNQPLSELRQDTYLSALTANSRIIHVVEGRFQERTERCRSCGAVRTPYDEKETDVNIAAALIRDVVADRYDTALLMTADSDLAPAIHTARAIRPAKRFVAVFPLRRRSDVLRRICDAALTIGDAKSAAHNCPTRSLHPREGSSSGRRTGGDGNGWKGDAGHVPERATHDHR